MQYLLPLLKFKGPHVQLSTLPLQISSQANRLPQFCCNIKTLIKESEQTSTVHMHLQKSKY